MSKIRPVEFNIEDQCLSRLNYHDDIVELSIARWISEKSPRAARSANMHFHVYYLNLVLIALQIAWDKDGKFNLVHDCN